MTQPDEKPAKDYKLIINRKQYAWPEPRITGADIKKLAESPADWVVNQRVPGPGEDPEIGDQEYADLAPNGVEQFTTRKPKTTPGV
jgi:hypothetical protein